MELEVLDVTSLAKRWNVTSKHIYDLVSQDAIPYFKVGRLVRFNTDTIIKFEKGEFIKCDNVMTTQSNMENGLPPERLKVSTTPEELEGLNPNLIRYLRQTPQ